MDAIHHVYVPEEDDRGSARGAYKRKGTSPTFAESITSRRLAAAIDISGGIVPGPLTRMIPAIADTINCVGSRRKDDAARRRLPYPETLPDLLGVEFAASSTTSTRSSKNYGNHPIAPLLSMMSLTAT